MTLAAIFASGRPITRDKRHQATRPRVHFQNVDFVGSVTAETNGELNIHQPDDPNSSAIAWPEQQPWSMMERERHTVRLQAESPL